MMRRAISNRTISATHLPIREPFLLFSLRLPGLYGLFGRYIFCASSLELELANIVLQQLQVSFSIYYVLA
jgi:hypothetical protein